MLTVTEAVLLVLALLLGAPAAAQPSPPSLPADPCAADPLTATPVSTRVAVTVNPATTWQPRGGEVIVKLEGDKALLAGERITACWRWGKAPMADPAASRPFFRGLIHNRPSDLEGVVNIGLMVPDLASAPEWFLTRVLPGGTLWTDGFGIVPAAEVRVILTNDTGPPETTVVRIGVTDPRYAAIVSVLLTALGLLVLIRFAGSRRAPGTGLIRVIASKDNMASLSSLQILLWSATVAFSAVYVMCLSGNLINLTPGTLVLLGVSGATTLATVLQPPRYAEAVGAEAKAAQQDLLEVQKKIAAAGEQAEQASRLAARTTETEVPAEVSLLAGKARTELLAQQDALQRIIDRAATARQLIDREPMWSDLLAPVDGAAGIDMSRAQMLFFTVVTSGFVLLKVLNTYIIPDIPEYYQGLIGISNGVYVAARAGTIQQQGARQKEAN
jgi:hypothetical protein